MGQRRSPNPKADRIRGRSRLGGARGSEAGPAIDQQAAQEVGADAVRIAIVGTLLRDERTDCD
jgi:hypothetical protein